MKEYLGSESTEESAAEEIVKTIYDCSLPLFRRTMESGRVRISFLDYHEVRMKGVTIQDMASTYTLPYRTSHTVLACSSSPLRSTMSKCADIWRIRRSSF